MIIFLLKNSHMLRRILHLALLLCFGTLTTNAQTNSIVDKNVFRQIQQTKSFFVENQSYQKTDESLRSTYLQRQNHVKTNGILYSQDFAFGLPASWENIDNAEGGQIWQFHNPGNRIINTATAANGFAIVDSRNYGEGNQNTDLITHTFDFSGQSLVHVEFQHYFKSYTTSSATFSYSIDNGATWIEVQKWIGNSTFNATVFNRNMGVELAGQTTVKFKWNYAGSGSWYWAVDDFCVYEAELYEFALTVPNGVSVKEGKSHQYAVTITNQGVIDDCFTVSYAGNGAWTYELFQADSTTPIADPIPITAETDYKFIIQVTLPNTGLSINEEDVANFSVTSAEGIKAVENFSITTSAIAPCDAPFYEDFTTYLKYWSEFKGALANPTSISGTYSIWEGGIFANTGLNKAMCANIFGSSKFEWLTTPEIRLGAGTHWLFFDMALTPWESSTVESLAIDDKFAVVVSIDGGTTWNLSDTLIMFDHTHEFSLNEQVALNLSAYSESTIMIGFYIESTIHNSDLELFIDNVTIREMVENDLAATGMTFDWAFAGTDTIPTVILQNMGSIEQNEFEVELNIRDGNIDVYTSLKTITGAAVVPNALFEVPMDIWKDIPEGEYSAVVTVTLADDVNIDNDIYINNFNAITIHFERDKVYTYNYWENTFAKIDIFSGKVSNINNITQYIEAGDFIGIGQGKTLWCIDHNRILYLIKENGAFYKYGAINGIFNIIGGFTWDATTNKIYTSDYGNSSVLYIVDNNLTATPIGEITSEYILAIAANSSGDLFGIGGDDNLYSIDKTTGAGTIIGSLGIDCQNRVDIGFDRTNDILYGTLSSNTTDDNGVYTIDVNTGNLTLISPFVDRFNLCAIEGNPQYNVTFSLSDGTSPVVNAEIKLFEHTLITDENGEAVINLIEGNYTYIVTADSYGPAFGIITIDGSDKFETITLNETSDVTFTVTDSADSIFGANVVINGFSMGVTDASGTLVVALSDGTYDYTVIASGFANELGQVSVAATDVNVSVTMIQDHAVTFVAADAYGVAIPNVTIAINDKILTTDAIGKAYIELKNGNYSYTATKDGLIDVAGNISITDMSTTENIEMSYHRYTVTFNVVDYNGDDLENAIIDFAGTKLTTDATGVGIIDTINGVYTYAATIPNYAPVVGNITVNNGNATELVAFSNDTAYMVTFTVIDENSSPIERANVAISNLNGLTNVSGVIRFYLPTRKYSYTVTNDNYDDFIGFISVGNTPTTVPTIAMTPTLFNINIAVRNEANEPIAGAIVTLDDEELITTATGIVIYQRFAGIYNWSVVKTDYIDMEGTVEVINANKTINAKMLRKRFTATLTVKNILGRTLENAVVEVNNDTLITNADGIIAVELFNGDYPYTITFDGYETYIGNITVSNENIIENIELTEIIIKPHGLDVTVKGSSATFTYYIPSASVLTESFEESFPPSGWTLDNTNISTWTQSKAIPTSEGDTITPPDGIYQTRIMWSYSSQNEWLITPSFKVPPKAKLTFWSYSKAFGSTHGDHYYVKVSTDSGATWTSIWDAVESADTIYEEVTVDISAFQGLYVMLAWQAVDGNGQGLWSTWVIDYITVGNANEIVSFSDVSTAAANSKMKDFVDYSIYLNDMTIPIAENVNTISWSFTELEEGNYTAGVQSIYETGASEIATIDFTLKNEYTVTFTVTDGINVIESAIININGVELITDTAGIATIELPNGTYIYTATAANFSFENEQVVVADADMAVDIQLTGMRDISMDFNIYPNPTTGILNVVAEGYIIIMVSNAIGQVVYTSALNGNGTIDLSNNASGVYFVRFQSGNNVTTQCIILK